MPTSLTGPRNLSDEPIVRPVHRDDYQVLLEAGRLDEYRTELVNGVIYEAPRVSPAHASGIGRVANALRGAFGERYLINTRLPVELDFGSVPEPDVSLIHRAPDDYGSRHPNAGETMLIVEISGSSLAFNRGAKAECYRDAGINDYWIVNIEKRQIEVYRMPDIDEEVEAGRSWEWRFVVPQSGSIAPLCAPHVEFAVADLLPTAPDNTKCAGSVSLRANVLTIVVAS